MLLTREGRGITIHGMDELLIIEEKPDDPALADLFERARRNLRWFNDHAMALEVFRRYRGHWIAVSEEEIFVAESASEAERLAKERHPSDVPHVQFIPLEKMERIYANQRRVADL